MNPTLKNIVLILIAVALIVFLVMHLTVHTK